MFGKKSRMSTNDKFVMSKGKQAGNFGTSGSGVSRGTKGGSKGKETPDPFAPRTLKVGKNSRFSSE